MKNLTWQNPEQLFVAQELINKVKSKCCGIKDNIMKEIVEKIQKEYEEFAVNAEAQVAKGNKAAGARARKAALALMKDFKEFRKLSVEASK